MSTHSGTIPNRRQGRQRSAQNPAAFRFVATVREEAPQPTPEAQALRDDAWTRWVLSMVNKEAACA